MIRFEDFAEKQESNLYVREAGSGMPMVLLHGFPETGGLWRNVAPALAGKFHMVIPDLPGSGKSALGEGLPTVDSIADTLYQYLTTAGIEKVILVGHSMGGYVALAFLEKYPEMIHGIAMVHTTSKGDTEERKEQRAKAAEMIRKGGKTEYLKTTVAKMFAPEYKEAHPEKFQKQLERGERMDSEALAQYNEALALRPDRTELLRESKTPVQWILGNQDQIVPIDDVLDLVALPTLSFLSLYKECGHLSPVEAPERLLADLSRFGRFCAVR